MQFNVIPRTCYGKHVNYVSMGIFLRSTRLAYIFTHPPVIYIFVKVKGVGGIYSDEGGRQVT